MLSTNMKTQLCSLDGEDISLDGEDIFVWKIYFVFYCIVTIYLITSKVMIEIIKTPVFRLHSCDFSFYHV